MRMALLLGQECPVCEVIRNDECAEGSVAAQLFGSIGHSTCSGCCRDMTYRLTRMSEDEVKAYHQRWLDRVAELSK